MKKDPERALAVLKEENLTLALCCGDETIKSRRRGVAALLELYDGKKELSAFCAADKVVGKGAAVLFSLLHVREVYSEVMSREAQELFAQNSIPFYCERTADCILNRSGTALCPIEEAVGGERDLEKARALIKERVRQMQSGSQMPDLRYQISF